MIENQEIALIWNRIELTWTQIDMVQFDKHCLWHYSGGLRTMIHRQIKAGLYILQSLGMHSKKSRWKTAEMAENTYNHPNTWLAFFPHLSDKISDVHCIIFVCQCKIVILLSIVHSELLNFFFFKYKKYKT